MPPQPEKVAEMKDWPSEEERAKLIAGLVDAIGSESPEVRYAAAMSLRIRRRPLEYFRDLQKIAKLRPSGTVTPDTTPRTNNEGTTTAIKGWLRRLSQQPDISTKG